MSTEYTKKYTKIDIVDMVSAKLITTEIKLTKKQISEILDIYQDTIYDILVNGEPVCFGNLGTFKFRTAQPREARPIPTNSKFPNPKGLKYTQPVPMHTKLKFQVSKNLAQEIKEKTINAPFNTKLRK